MEDVIGNNIQTHSFCLYYQFSQHIVKSPDIRTTHQYAVEVISLIGGANLLWRSPSQLKLSTFGNHEHVLFIGTTLLL